VRADAEFAGLGLLLLQFLTRTEPHLAIGALGLNPTTIPIYRALGFRVGELQHYVRINGSIDAVEIATLASRHLPPPDEAPLNVRRLTRDSEFRQLDGIPHNGAVPRKTIEYFRTRYARHPVYSYVVVALPAGGEPGGLMAARTAEHAGRRALRIVDYVGSEGVLACSGPAVQMLLEEAGAEYADVYNTGIDAAVFADAGFVRIDPDGPDV